MLDPKKQTQAPKTPGISSRESAIEQLLKRIHRNDEFPSVSKHLIEINRQLAVNIEASDASELANVILKDHALTSKLLKLVNSAFFGFAAGSVSTVTRAVVLLGNENIRLAAVNLAVFEHFNSKSNTLDLKETVVNAFWSGVVARDMARMNTQVDPEEAFVCAMMCRLGKMVMIYYLPEEYQQIIRRMADNGGSETKAVRAVCGVTYDELGAAVARQWNFPSQLCENIMPLTKEALRDKRHPPNPLRALTSFVKELGGTLQDGTIESDHKCFEHLVEKYQPLLHLTKGQLSGLIKDSVEQVRRHAQALNYNLSQCDFLRQLDYLNNPGKSSNAKAGLPPSASRPKDLFGPEDAEHPKDSPAVPKNTSDIIMAGIQEMSEAMLADNDVNDVALISLEILYRSLDFQRALMFARDGRSDTMTVRFGYGEKVQQLIRKAGFNVGRGKDLFNLSIRVGKDLIVPDARNDDKRQLLPQWYFDMLDAPAFIFLPIMVQKVCIGAFYADRNQSGPPLRESEHNHLSMLRNQLVLAIKYRQSRR